MALEAMAEADWLDVDDKSKPKTLHDYKNSKWEGLYDKADSVHKKADHIHVIEEDVENEIDSDYSMTLKNGRGQVIRSLNREIEADNYLFVLDSSKDTSF